MNCSSCGHENPPGSKFCLECGRPFTLRCPQCGSDLPATAKFCNECGEPVTGQAAASPDRAPRDYTPKHLADKILQSKSALEGERKQVTVLFADVKGSMELAEQVDPEEWHGILDRFFQILADGVHRFEGTVNQYTGDGIMALFGAPIAHEDHAQRAGYAALWLRDELRRYADGLRVERGLNFAVRIGLNSGEVVVGRIGDDLRMDYTAQGQTVGLAARIEQMAASDSVYVAERTARLVEGFFRLRDLGQSKIKGVAEPLRVYELEGAGPLRTRLDVARVRGFSRFVGRADEMATLELALNRAREGNGQVVGVVGEAGVGKSRLCLEFVERCKAKGVEVYEAHCPAHGRAVPFLPLLELLRNVFGISQQDSDQEARQKIAGTLVLLDEAFQEVLPLVFDFLGVPDPSRPAPRIDPDGRQRRLSAFMQRLIRQTSQEEPAIVLIDDLHWIDAGSDAFLAQMVEAVNGTSTMLLVNFRPEYQADWVGKSYYHQLPVAPLGTESVGELLNDLLGQDPSLAGLHDLIRERTGGNPFFTEELVHSLVESKHLEGAPGRYRLITAVEGLEVPSTVQPVLAARIDRLSEREKRVLQTAAVIGKEFSEPILHTVAELPEGELVGALSALKAAEFIYEKALYPVAEYAFRHPLTQEVALGSQLQERRRQLHAAVARAIEAASAEKLDEAAPLLAHHWEQAAEPLEAARWHRRAAEWISTRDMAATIAHWKQVRALLRPSGQTAETLDHGLAACTGILTYGWREGLSRDEADEIFAEGLALARQRRDLFSEAVLFEVYGALVGLLGGEIGFWEEQVLEAARLAEQTGHLGLRLGIQGDVVFCQMARGALQTALLTCEKARELAAGDPLAGQEIWGGMAPYASLLFSTGLVLTYLGRLGEARVELDRALDVSHQAADPEGMVFTYYASVNLAGIQGDCAETLATGRRAVEVAEEIGSPTHLATAYTTLAKAQSQRGEWSEAVEAAEHSLSSARISYFGLDEEARITTLAEAYLGSGDAARAQTTAERAVSLSRERGTRIRQIEAELTLARALIQAEGIEARARIEQTLERAGALVDETGALGLKPGLCGARAELALLIGDGDAQRQQLREAYRLYTGMGATGHAERLAKELGL